MFEKVLFGFSIMMFSCVTFAASYEQMRVGHLIDDYVPANAGAELIIPYFRESADGSSFDFRFDIYRAGTREKLFSTASKKISAPSVPCDMPQWVDYNVETAFEVSDQKFIAAVFEYEVECQEFNDINYKDDAVVYAYLSRIDAAGRPVRVVNASGELVGVGKGKVDFNNNGREDLVITLANDVNVGENLTVVIIDMATRKTLSIKTYPLSRDGGNT